MAKIPAQTVQAAVRAHECAWTAGASRRDLVRATLEAAMSASGMVIVSAEDLRTVFAHWLRPVTNQLGGQDAYARLRAALPEETTTDER